jgi:hypothetical protein
MSVYVKAGQCEKEVVIKIKKKKEIFADVEVETNCDYIKNLVKELKDIKVGEEFTLPITETKVYKTSSKYLCRTSCVVPSAIIKAIEEKFKIFAPKNIEIEFIDL